MARRGKPGKKLDFRETMTIFPPALEDASSSTNRPLPNEMKEEEEEEGQIWTTTILSCWRWRASLTRQVRTLRSLPVVLAWIYSFRLSLPLVERRRTVKELGDEGESDDEDKRKEKPKKEVKKMNARDIQGQEKTGADYDDGQKLEPFNMNEELEEG
jgi:hypothetical protein